MCWSWQQSNKPTEVRSYWQSPLGWSCSQSSSAQVTPRLCAEQGDLAQAMEHTLGCPLPCLAPPWPCCCGTQDVTVVTCPLISGCLCAPVIPTVPRSQGGWLLPSAWWSSPGPSVWQLMNPSGSPRSLNLSICVNLLSGAAGLLRAGVLTPGRRRGARFSCCSVLWVHCRASNRFLGFFSCTFFLLLTGCWDAVH